ncbi:MAG TPA: DEAD/DEAH box helicase [Bacteroides sp.]|nr:DEAD/DEAH box helicase [Bacteroides sp.]
MNGNNHIVVATDLLSRGIDVKDIDLIINYDVPMEGEDYIHRIPVAGSVPLSTSAPVSRSPLNPCSGTNNHRMPDTWIPWDSKVSSKCTPSITKVWFTTSASLLPRSMGRYRSMRAAPGWIVTSFSPDSPSLFAKQACSERPGLPGPPADCCWPGDLCPAGAQPQSALVRIM